MVVQGICISPREILTPALHPRADLRVVVSYHDGRLEEAKILGTDPLSNLALIEVPADSPAFIALRAAAVAASQTLRIVGYQGRCDGKPRLVSGRVGSEHVALLLQDFYGVTGKGCFPLGSAFSIGTFEGQPNPGSACVDDEGHLVGFVIGGMPTRVVADPDQENRLRPFELRFALPAARVERIVGDLRRHHRVIRACFGLDLEPADPALLAQFELPKSACAVKDMLPHGARAGFLVHDVLLTADGHAYRDMYELREVLSEKPPGKPVTFEVLRRGERKALEATPVELE
jgi:S1-C subfamily serine protease